MSRKFGLFIIQVQFGLATLNNLSCRFLNNTLYFKTLAMASSNQNSCQLVKDLSYWKFSESKLLELPIDQERQNFLRRNNRGCLFSYVLPTPLKKPPTLVAFSKDVLTTILNMDPIVTITQEFADFISGSKLLKNSITLAHRYGGHQFGMWAMQLGDGRAILLGEYHNSVGERWELQLKGSGRTPYSRDGDGRAVLRSSIREFLCSEAMHYLGVPTSRAGALVVSEELVMRDPLYDGRVIMEKTAVVLRLAPSWFRFGSFELLYKTNEIDLLRMLFDFILKEHFPDIDPSSEEKVLTFLSRVCRTTSDLLVKWQAVGFTHGVLNTDNMSILGITIDYGPFGFVEGYDPDFTPNASDTEGYYSYARQEKVINWNLKKLSLALTPLMTAREQEQVSVLLESEAKYITDNLHQTFSTKLGLPKTDMVLLYFFMAILEETKSDFTMTFRDLSEISLEDMKNPCPSKYWALGNFSRHPSYSGFVDLYRKKLEALGVTDKVRQKQMCEVNPRYVLKNWIAERAIKMAQTNNFSGVKNLLRILSNPFVKQEEAEQLGLAGPSPDWASNLRLSCSS